MGILSINRNLLSNPKSKLKSLSSSSFSSSSSSGLGYIRKVFSRIFSPAAVPPAPTVAGKFMCLIEHVHQWTSTYSVLSATEKNNNSKWKLDNLCCPFSGKDHWIDSGCNGIYLVFDLNLGEYLWNPTIKVFQTLPRSQVPCPRYSVPEIQCLDTHGFGFNSASNDYKVIRFLQFEYPKDPPFVHLLVELYSLNTNSWKEITYPYPGCYPLPPCVHINGVCYWATQNWPSKFILSFDFATEKFSFPPNRIPFPSDLPQGIANYRLVEFDGSLAVIVHSELRRRTDKFFSFRVCVWDGETWSSEKPAVTIDDSQYPVASVLGLFQKYKLFLQAKGDELLLFHCEKGVLENLGTIQADPGLINIYPFSTDFAMPV